MNATVNSNGDKEGDDGGCVSKCEGKEWMQAWK